MITALVCNFLLLCMLVLFARAILSWFPIDYDSPVRKVQEFLHAATEPVLAPIRNVLPPLTFGGGMGLDLSFLVVMFGLMIVRAAIC